MSTSKIWDHGVIGLDTEQLRLVLADVNAGHRALVEELTGRLQESEGARDRLKTEVDQLRKDLHDLEINQAVDANPEVIWARKKAEEAREKELDSLTTKVHDLEKQVALLNAEKTTLTNEKNALASDKLALQREVGELKTYVDSLERTIREASYFGKPELPKRPAKPGPGATST